MEGQYVHIVADLSHLVGSYTMSLCSIGVMGALYIRAETLPERIDLYEGESLRLAVPHIFNEFSTGTEHTINLRQANSSQLPFVAISEEIGQSIVLMDSAGAAIGDYELQLESYDASGSIQSTLKTDIIQVSIIAVQEDAALIIVEPQSIFISAVETSSWSLNFD